MTRAYKTKPETIRIIPVENFLSSCLTLESRLLFDADVLNLDADTKSYGWNDATRSTIYQGLCLLRKGKKLEEVLKSVLPHAYA